MHKAGKRMLINALTIYKSVTCLYHMFYSKYYRQGKAFRLLALKCTVQRSKQSAPNMNRTCHMVQVFFLLIINNVNNDGCHKKKKTSISKSSLKI